MKQDNIKICIVDDNLDVCSMLSDFFNKISDINICSIDNDGETGLNNILKYKPDIILLDFIMPNFDGLCVLKKLKELNSPSKVIMLTAISQDSIAQEAFNLGSYYYMLKPFKLSVLEERIRSIYNFNKNELSHDLEIHRSVENQIIEKVIKVGIPTNILGYQYIIDAITLLISNNSPIFIKNIYQIIADKNITTEACVESAMRNAILQASKQSNESFIKIFTEINKRPTNSQFLTKLCQNIKFGL